MSQSRSDFQWGFTHVVQTTLVHTGPGGLHTIILNQFGDDCTITVYDGVDATGTIIGIITTALHQPQTLKYDLIFDTGLYIAIVGEGTADLTVCWI
jgi:hypothetical protein